MQAAELKFRRWMQILLGCFLFTVCYLIFAERYSPITTESMVQGYVVKLAPEVSGYITEVNISNNQQVKAGELLFQIDDRKLKLAQTSAKLALQQAQERESVLYAQAAAARATITTSKAAADNALRDYQRLQKLAKTGAVSDSQLDQAATRKDQTTANLNAAQQQLKALLAQLGHKQGQSSAVLAAENALAQANLALSHSQVRAPSDGVVTNLQLHKGSFANANQPLVSFIPTKSLWIAADFREKATAILQPGMTAEVAFDGLPGEIAELTLTSRDFGVASAQQQANGQLATITSSNRWVRDAQRVRVNLASNNPLPENLFVGSRATVIIYPTDNPVMVTLGKGLIRLISLLHFVY